MKNPDPSPYMRWWDEMDYCEMMHLRMTAPAQHRFPYVIKMARGSYDHAVRNDIELRDRQWYRYLGDRHVDGDAKPD
jgi:hypothetical protein